MKLSAIPARTLTFGYCRNTHFALLALGLLLTGAAGCGSGGGGGTTSGAVATGGGTTLTPVVSTVVTAPALSNFTASLTESQAAISAGGAVSYTFTLANTSSTPATVITDTQNGAAVPKATLRVTDSTGKTVYPAGAAPLDVPPPPPTSGVTTLQPNTAISFSQTVSVFSKADTYYAVATFTVASSGSDTPQTITLSPLTVTVR